MVSVNPWYMDLSEMPMDNNHQQTTTWQQNQYMAVSGIQSTAQAPSLSVKSHVDDLDGPDHNKDNGRIMFNWNHQGMGAELYTGNGCR
ncbi:catenin beta-like [Dreissena polymorpha]|uniref:catenin beta-like n=1 Tax=Dreissena polymorpha TaxID=45954 RepID=UPI002263E7C4|nr:catenin beta-like [Dreissena polymorpha]